MAAVCICLRFVLLSEGRGVQPKLALKMHCVQRYVSIRVELDCYVSLISLKVAVNTKAGQQEAPPHAKKQADVLHHAGRAVHIAVSTGAVVASALS